MSDRYFGVPGQPRHDGRVTLCDTIATYGRGNLTYTVKHNGTTYTKQATGENGTPNLSLRAVRRVAGAANSDGFSGSDRNRAAIIFLHGGSFSAGGRDDLMPYARQFAKQGFVSVLANYSHVPDSDFALTVGGIAVNQGTSLTIMSVSQEAQRNVQSAVRYLRARSTALGVNPNRIYVVGVSAGGLTAARLATRPLDTGTDKALRDAPSGVAGQANQPSKIRGAVPISAVECSPTSPAQQTVAGATYNTGTCNVDPQTPEDAPFGMLHGASDGALPYNLANQACIAYAPKCIGITPYYAYPWWEIGQSTHSDGSVGTCNYQGGNAIWSGTLAPGGDHFFSDSFYCQSRAGVVSANGNAAPGMYANMNNSKATVVMQIFKAVTHPTWL